MKTYIRHRVNRIAELESLDSSMGAEIDLRSMVSSPGRLHLSHDPWVVGDDFEAWLAHFASRGIQGPIILNTKEDGLEARTIELLDRFKISNYFFLDTALPTLVRMAIREGNSKFAVRLSVHEPVENVRPFIGKVDWVWIDCFEGEPISAAALSGLKSKANICLVSPELQGKPIELIPRFEELFQVANAVCTKSPQAWKQAFSK